MASRRLRETVSEVLDSVSGEGGGGDDRLATQSASGRWDIYVVYIERSFACVFYHVFSVY
jgi:hypothetical protein